MMKLSRLSTIWMILVLALLTATLAIAGPGHNTGDTPPALGKDLAVKLNIPLFDPEFSDTPVARVGETPILLKTLTPSLRAKEKILLWEVDTSEEDLTEQFKKALDAGIKKDASGRVEYFTDARISEGPLLSLDAPLFSSLFTDVPVALVNQTPVTVAEFSQNLQAVHSETMENATDSSSSDKIQQLIDRLIKVRLVEQEARNIGFDQTGSFRKQADAFAERTLLYALLDKQAQNLKLDQAAVNEMYQKISLKGSFRSFRFSAEDDAKSLHTAYENGKNFERLIADALKRGVAVEEDQQGEILFKELLPNIASAASDMAIGEVSQIFRQDKNFIIFKLVSKSFVEDIKALDFARKSVWEKQTAEFGAEFITELNRRYAEFDEDAHKDLDFSQIIAANPEISLGDALQPLLVDKRTLVRVEGAKPGAMTVAELAGKIRETYFHGVDKQLNPVEVDIKKDEILEDALFRMSGMVEAQKLGLDQVPEYRRALAEHDRGLLFDIFMQKVVNPEVRPTEKEMQQHYREHLDEFMTPAMFKFKSLPFHTEAEALKAADKLQRGSDFKWVSANAEGLVDFQNEDILPFNDKILSLSSLPETLQSRVSFVQRGDALVHAEPNNFYYVLYIQELYPSAPKPYEDVRKEVIETVYRQSLERTLDEWVEKLKGAYEVEIFLAADRR